MHKVLLSGLLSLMFGGMAAAQPVGPRSIPYSMLGANNGAAALDANGALSTTNLLRSRANLGFINPQQLPHWRAALATLMNTTSAPFVHPRIMMMIDSTTMGENSLGVFTPKNVSYWLAQDLVAAGIPANNNSICGGSVANQSTSVVPGNRTSTDPRFSEALNGVWGTFNGNPTAGGNGIYAAVTGPDMTYTPSAAGAVNAAVDTFLVTYNGYGNSAATATFTATGGTGVALSEGAGSNVSPVVLQSTVSAGSVSAANALTMHFTGTTNNDFFLDCVEAYNSTANSVDIINAGWWASTTGMWNSGTLAFSPLQMIQYQAPTVGIIMAPINDWNQNVPTATTMANLQALISAVQVSGDAILVSGVPNNNNPTLQAADVAAMRALAANDNIPFVDLNGRFVSWASANALGLESDTNAYGHPNGPGYYDAALPIAKLLLSPQ